MGTSVKSTLSVSVMFVLVYPSNTKSLPVSNVTGVTFKQYLPCQSKQFLGYFERYLFGI